MYHILVYMYVCIIYGWVEAWMHVHIQYVNIHTCTFLHRKREHVVGASSIRYRVCMCVCIMYWYVCMCVSYMDGWKHGCIWKFIVYVYIRAVFYLESGKCALIYIYTLSMHTHPCFYPSMYDSYIHTYIRTNTWYIQTDILCTWNVHFCI